MKLPSEGELIEMEQRLRQLAEVECEIRRLATKFMNGDNRDSLLNCADDLESLSGDVDSLLDLIRSQMAVPQ